MSTENPQVSTPGIEVAGRGLSEQQFASLQWLRCMKKPIPIRAVRMDSAFVVQSLEGRVVGKAGDYLMQGVRGELYCCDATIFEQSYNLIGDE